MEEKIPSSGKMAKIFLGIVCALILLGAGGAGGWYFYQWLNAAQKASEEVNPPTEIPTESQGDILWKGLIPLEYDPDLIPKSYQEGDEYVEGYITKYYEVGEFRSGKYTGAKLVLAFANQDVMEGDGGFLRFVERNGKYILLTRHSTELLIYTDPKNKFVEKFERDNDYRIPELEIPEIIQGPKSRQILNRVGTGILGHNIEQLIPVFADARWGTIYREDDFSPGSKNNNYRSNGFYLWSPDGLETEYTIDLNFVQDNVPAVTWNDGAINNEEYTHQTVGGCGMTDRIAVVTNKIKTEALQEVGKTSEGDPVYEPKDPNHEIWKNIYENEYTSFGDEAMQTDFAKEKLPYEQFTKIHPAFFWVDPFGRIIKFQNSKFLPPGECGKPVIYLYPGKTTKVNVKVRPGGGFSKTEPAYGNGWTVMAEPNGRLTNLSDGKTYPYLFWEGRSNGIYTQSEKGFVVARLQVHEFLMNSLGQLGLNIQEKTDFAEFWEPRMQSAPYYFVAFLGNKTMNQLAPLEITPKPDTVIRVLMDFTPLQNPIAVQTQQLKAPERKGFTVIEWGGVIR